MDVLEIIKFCKVINALEIETKIMWPLTCSQMITLKFWNEWYRQLVSFYFLKI